MKPHQKLLAILLGFEALTAIPTAAMPGFVGRYVDSLGFDLALAGRIASVEALGMALGQVLATLLVRPGSDLRRLLFWSLATFAAAQLLSLIPGLTWLFAGARLLSGTAGAGLVFALVGVYIARLPNADRAYPLYYGMLFVVGPIGLYLLPTLLARVELSHVYLALAVVTVAVLPLLRSLESLDRRVTAAPVHAATPTRGPIGFAALLLMLSLFLNYVGNGGVWVYMDRVGAAFGLDESTRGFYLAIGMLAGLAGSAAALYFTDRTRRLTALVIGNLLLALSYLLPLWPGRAIPAFVAAALLLNVAVTFFTPFYLAALARTDTTGRNVALGILAFGLGYGIGPAALSPFITDSGFAPMLLVALGTALLSLVLVVAAARRSRSESGESGTQAFS